MRILLTGSSGFIGSHIAEVLHNKGHKLLLTKRGTSHLWRCASFIEGVEWVDCESANFEKEVQSFNPQIIINAAWNGVSAKDRDNWQIQIDNLKFQQLLLDFSDICEIKKYIGIGSQAEYGTFDGIINENFPTNPNSAYGVIKLSAQIIVKAFCERNNIKWYWFRLFSAFGEKESENWLIPSAIKKMINNKSMDLTPGEQKYSYLYVQDIANLFQIAVESNADCGVYHIASDEVRQLKTILENIKEKVSPSFKLNFGALPYRTNQSMINGSDNSKTKKAFGNYELSDFNEAINRTVEYYKTYFCHD